MLAAVEPRAFYNEVQQRVWWKETGKNPGETARILDQVKEQYFQRGALEAANNAAAGRNERRREGKPPSKKGGRQQAAVSAPANARGAFRAPVSRC